MKRAIGYCETRGGAIKTPCKDFGRGVFLLNHGKYFYCAECTEPGHVEPEVGVLTGKTGTPVKEVRVEFNFDLHNRTYREIAIVRDESLYGTGRTYTLKSPLIRTEKRALKVAESILANLQLTVNIDDKIPSTTETVLSFDDSREDFFASLRRLQEGWKSSNLCKNK